MQQVMSMNDLYGRSNSDDSANYFEHSYATQVTRMDVTLNSYPVPWTIASGFHSAQYAANHYSQMNEYTSTNVPSNNTQAYSTPSQKICTALRSLPESYSAEHTIYDTHHIIL
jgi:hypothetical protein